MEEVLILFLVVVTMSHILEGITGFGCTVVAMPFCIYLLGAKTAIPVLVILSLLFDLALVIPYYKKIVWRQLLVIVGFVIFGIPIGVLIFKWVPENILTRAIGVFMIGMSIYGIAKMYISSVAQVEIKMWVKKLLLFIGGIVHGAFGASGPFIIVYAEGAIRSKEVFRTTLAFVWVILNSFIVIQYYYSGFLTPHVLDLTMYAIIPIFIAYFIGNYIHKKADERMFSIMIYVVLFISGIFTLLK